MTEREKIYILKHTANGVELLRAGESDQTIEGEDQLHEVPALSKLTTPRWSHWYQRKLARPWQATLLGMNIEPVSNGRRILKAHDETRYRTFRDRLDILQTLMGLEIGVYENHIREGDGANEKYIELAEYCRYAESLEWSGMEAMHSGLRLDDKPPKLNLLPRQHNNVLVFLDAVLRCAVPGYSCEEGKRSPTAVLKWMEDKGEEKKILSDGTLKNWFIEMQDLASRE